MCRIYICKWCRNSLLHPVNWIFSQCCNPQMKRNMLCDAWNGLQYGVWCHAPNRKGDTCQVELSTQNWSSNLWHHTLNGIPEHLKNFLVVKWESTTAIGISSSMVIAEIIRHEFSCSLNKKFHVFSGHNIVISLFLLGKHFILIFQSPIIISSFNRVWVFINCHTERMAMFINNRHFVTEWSKRGQTITILNLFIALLKFKELLVLCLPINGSARLICCRQHITRIFCCAINLESVLILVVLLINQLLNLSDTLLKVFGAIFLAFSVDW